MHNYGTPLMSNCLQRILFLPNNFMEICPNYQLKVWLWGSLYNNTCIYIVNVYLEGHGSSKFNATCFVLIGRHCCGGHLWGSLIIPQNALPSPSVKLTSINNLFLNPEVSTERTRLWGSRPEWQGDPGTTGSRTPEEKDPEYSRNIPAPHVRPNRVHCF